MAAGDIYQAGVVATAQNAYLALQPGAVQHLMAKVEALEAQINPSIATIKEK